MPSTPLSTTAPRIGGWLLLPLAWLILSLLSSTLALANYVMAMTHPALRSALFSLTETFAWQFILSLLVALAMWLYSTWVTWMFCMRSHRLPRHYIIWLLVTILLAIRSFAFTPVTDEIAVQNLLITLLSAAVFVPYFKRSQRVKTTFISP